MARFVKGQSGNPQGRPKGKRPVTRLRAAIEQEITPIIDSLIAQARGGDVSAAKILVDKVIPNLKSASPPMTIPGIKDKTLSDQGSAVIALMGTGKVSPEAAQAALSSLASLVKLSRLLTLSVGLPSWRLQAAAQIKTRLVTLEKLHIKEPVRPIFLLAEGKPLDHLSSSCVRGGKDFYRDPDESEADFRQRCQAFAIKHTQPGRMPAFWHEPYI